MNLDNLQNIIGNWGDETFKQSTPKSVVSHFKKESQELYDAIMENHAIEHIKEETADCLMLLIHIAHKNNFSLEQSLLNKFEINKNRKWGEPDADGVCEHIR